MHGCSLKAGAESLPSLLLAFIRSRGELIAYCREMTCRGYISFRGWLLASPPSLMRGRLPLGTRDRLAYLPLVLRTLSICETAESATIFYFY